MDNSQKSGKKMPVLFLAHGSPMNIIADNRFTQSLHALGQNLPKPKAILVISAHWLSNGTKVLCSRTPRTIYDFYGFPKELYKITYPSPGCPEIAKKIIQKAKSYEIKCDYEWGFDHASWSILRHIYPKAQIPLIELSLDYQFISWNPKPIEYHYRLAKGLKFLRDEEVLIIGSGNIIHNLGIFDYEIDAPVMRWAKDFDDKIKKNLLSKSHEELMNYQTMGDGAIKGIPTWDHYLPMIYIISMQEENEAITFIHEGFQHGSISMRSFKID